MSTERVYFLDFLQYKIDFSISVDYNNVKAKGGLVGTFKNGETTSSVTMNAQMSPGARAGSYTGTATFSVRLE